LERSVQIDNGSVLKAARLSCATAGIIHPAFAPDRLWSGADQGGHVHPRTGRPESGPALEAV